MSPAELCVLIENIQACHTCLLQQLHAGLLRAATFEGLRAAALIDEELRTRREIEALCTPANRISAIALCMSMRIGEVRRRWERAVIDQAVLA